VPARRIRLFEVLGFPIRLDPSWFVVLLLLTWSLGSEYFPARVGGLPVAGYWAMGAIATVGLFACVVLHELAHAVVARRFGLEMRGITLFLFGGVAEMPDEPPSPKAEALVALAGPAASAALAGGLFVAAGAGRIAGIPAPVTEVVAYLALLNVVLVVFNCIPAFPLDGGRVLRAILWGRSRSLRRATRVTAAIGSGFGFALLILGVLRFVGGDFVGGLWAALVGLFLRGAAQMSERNAVIRDELGDLPIDRFATRDPVVVAPGECVETLVNEYFYRHYHGMFPVVDDGRVVGCVRTKDVRDVDRSAWATTTVGSIMERCTDENTVAAGTPAAEGMRRLGANGFSRLMVVRGGRLEGVVAGSDLIRFLARREEIGTGG
jgi:Zn-dependent protease